MNELWSKIKTRFLRQRAVALGALVSVLLVAGAWWWAWASLRGISQPLIIQFAAGKGITKVGSLGDLAAMGLVALVAVLANAAVAFEVDARDPFWGKFLMAGTFAFATLIFIAFAAIISVN